MEIEVDSPLQDNESVVVHNSSKGKIKRIDKGSVHRICSGQVILDLSSAVKELIENSLDAGATSIEIKLKEFGTQLIEVIDNGCGVDESDFEALVQKHATSKLNNFEDLPFVSSFGFRGEALSSLCAMSSVTVCTRTSNVSMGSKLTYNSDGELTSRTAQARNVGTTVSLTGIFSSLPVRHQELMKNSKKEFAKMQNVIQQYAIISTGVKMKCHHIYLNGKGGKSLLLSTNGSESILDNISCVFGPKFAKQLERVENAWDSFSLSGYVSSAAGRSSTDKQLLFVNKRPVDMPKITKVINDVYHSLCNRKEYPILILNITTSTDRYDVNVTPNKRKIFLHDESAFKEAIKSYFEKHWDSALAPSTPNKSARVETLIPSDLYMHSPSQKSPISSTLVANKLSTHVHTIDLEAEETPVVSPKTSKFFHTSSLERSASSPILSSSIKSPLARFALKKSASSPPLLSTVQSNNGNTTTPVKNKDEIDLDDIGDFDSDEPTDEANFTSSVPTLNYDDIMNEEEDEEVIQSSWSSSDELLSPQQSIKEEKQSTKEEKQSIKEEKQSIKVEKQNTKEQRDSTKEDKNSSVGTNASIGSPKKPIDFKRFMISQHNAPANTNTTNNSNTNTKFINLVHTAREDHSDSHDGQNVCQNSVAQDKDLQPPQKKRKLTAEDITIITDDELPKYDKVIAEQWTFDLGAVMQKFSERLGSSGNAQKSDNSGNNGPTDGSFISSVNSSTNDEEAATELKRVFRKEYYQDMEVIGQFNLGFIIAKLKNDLFIVDQHASDEKFNYEVLQKTTTINSQKLLSPQALELTAEEELIVIDNMETFKKNGFDFEVDDEAPPTTKLKLTSFPFSKNHNFGTYDVYELISKLREDDTGSMCRLSRISLMFASRACRKSIMIGTALDKREMKQVLTNMGKCDNPWSCPHGRPTMRHLLDLRMLKNRQRKTPTTSKLHWKSAILRYGCRDIVMVFEKHICHKIFDYLDSQSLGHARKVNRHWKISIDQFVTNKASIREKNK